MVTSDSIAVSQTVTGLHVGSTYVLSVEYYWWADGGPPTMSCWVSGKGSDNQYHTTQITIPPIANSGVSTSWTTMSLPWTAVGSSALVACQLSTSYNDLASILITDVQLVLQCPVNPT